jgi:hypothetical protein
MCEVTVGILNDFPTVQPKNSVCSLTGSATSPFQAERTGAYIIAVHADSGKIAWKRRESSTGTPLQSFTIRPAARRKLSLPAPTSSRVFHRGRRTDVVRSGSYVPAKIGANHCRGYCLLRLRLRRAPKLLSILPVGSSPSHPQISRTRHSL